MKITLVLSIIGILLLFFISDKIKPKEYSLSELSKEVLEKEIKVKGEITKITEKPELTIMYIKDSTEKEIKVISFGKLNLKKGLNIEVIGKLKSYKNELEIEAKEINLIKD